jgi:hypothetical protein
VRASPAPPHLVLLDHPLTDHLVDRRLHKAGRYALLIAPPLSIIDDPLLEAISKIILTELKARFSRILNGNFVSPSIFEIASNYSRRRF